MIPLRITVSDIEALAAAITGNLYNAGYHWKGKGGVKVKRATVRKLRALNLLTTIREAGGRERAFATGDGITIHEIARRNCTAPVRLAVAGGRPAHRHARAA